MKSVKKFAISAVLLLICIFSFTACDSFYELFVEEGAGQDGVYYVIYDETNTDEEIAAIPDVHFTAGDLTKEIKKYGLSYEITVAFDTETTNEASLSCYYYHNRNDESASDYCRVGISFLGTYVMEDDKITFTMEKEGYNIAIYTVGSDYSDIEEFQNFSFAEDKGNGVWAYKSATYDYEDAVIDERILEGVPDTVVFTVSGNKLVSWEAAE